MRNDNLLAFFPQCNEDELLYSILARYHLMSGNTNFKSSLNDLFGKESICTVSDLPGHLRRLCKRLPKEIFSPRILAEKHTLLPYYAPFLPVERLQLIRKAMYGDNSGGVHMRAGIMASTICVPLYLRYCPNCYKADAQRVGEAYWHRVHQVPGVYLCPIHNTLLLESNVLYSSRGNQHELEVLSVTEVLTDKVQVSYDSKVSVHYQFIAEQTQWLLNNSRSSISQEKLREFYVHKLIKFDLCTYSGRIRFQELLPAFNKFYGESFLEKMQSYISEDEQDAWLQKLLRKPRVSCHPLRHILFLRFLGESVNNLCSWPGPKRFQPFGKGPWPCLNKASEHYRQNVISHCSITICKETLQPVGTFECDCGFIYTRKGTDAKKEDRYKGKAKQYGDVWQAALENFSGQNISLREMARRLGVDVYTVKRYLLTRETSGSSLVQFENNTFKEKLSSYRNKWFYHIEVHKSCSRTELRLQCPSVYTWLYRHDRDWLMSSLPQPRKPIPRKKNRVNWEKRDEELYHEIKRAVEELINIRPPVRLTIGSIGKHLHQISILEQHLDKLPKSKKLLKENIETVDKFRSRRVKLVAEALRAQGENIKEWRIIRESGLRPDYGAIVQDCINDEINKH